MTILQGALESGAPAPGGGGEQIRMIWARTRPWPAQFLCAPNRRYVRREPMKRHGNSSPWVTEIGCHSLTLCMSGKSQP